MGRMYHNCYEPSNAVPLEISPYLYSHGTERANIHFR